MPVYSLRRRLTLILTGLILITWILAMVITALVSQQLIYQQIDRQLTHYMDMAHHTARVIISNRDIARYFESFSNPIENNPDFIRMTNFGSRGIEQGSNMWFGRRQIIIGEHTPRFPRAITPGFKTIELEEADQHSNWRILYRYDPNERVWLAVGINMQYAESFSNVTLWRSLLPLAIILPVFILILLWGIKRGLKPLNNLAGSIALRKPQALESIDLHNVPAELAPVVTSLNTLLDRLARALSSEQRFTSNAAHELQTPLSAIKAEVQRYQRHIDDPEILEMLQRIYLRVSRATDTVQQLLTLARLDPDQDFHRERIAFNQLLIEVLAEHGAIAVDHGITINLNNCEELVWVSGNAEWLKIMLSNLLLNAIHHSITPGVIEISLKVTANKLTLAISNDCESIPPQEFQRLSDRFFRPAGSARPGLGLGLSIVQRIASLHGTSLELEHHQTNLNTDIFKATISFAVAD